MEKLNLKYAGMNVKIASIFLKTVTMVQMLFFCTFNQIFRNDVYLTTDYRLRRISFLILKMYLLNTYMFLRYLH